MKIELFTFVFNDEDILPFFIRHYAPIVDKMTFIDSDSTDKTLKLIEKYEVIQTGFTWWDWDEYHKIRNIVWKQSEYDLIFFPDVDEFLYRRNLREFLEKNEDVYDIYQMEGFQMISANFPKPETDILEIKVGIPLPLHSKYAIFNPKADIYFPDAHNVETTSENVCRFEIKLLHYKYLGVRNMLRRAELIKSRVPSDSYTAKIKGNILERFSSFIKTEKEYTREFKQLLNRATKVI